MRKIAAVTQFVRGLPLIFLNFRSAGAMIYRPHDQALQDYNPAISGVCVHRVGKKPTMQELLRTWCWRQRTKPQPRLCLAKRCSRTHLILMR